MFKWIFAGMAMQAGISAFLATVGLIELSVGQQAIASALLATIAVIVSQTSNK